MPYSTPHPYVTCDALPQCSILCAMSGTAPQCPTPMENCQMLLQTHATGGLPCRGVPCALEWHCPMSPHAPTPTCSASQLYTLCQWQGSDTAPWCPMPCLSAEAPRFESIMEDIDAQEGETPRFAVVVEGKPLPDIMWYKVSWDPPNPFLDHIPTRPTHFTASLGLLHW